MVSETLALDVFPHLLCVGLLQPERPSVCSWVRTGLLHGVLAAGELRFHGTPRLVAWQQSFHSIMVPGKAAGRDQSRYAAVELASLWKRNLYRRV